MADLNDLERAEAIKIVGSAPDGTETNPVGASNNRELFAADTCNNGGVHAELTVGSTPVELKAGASVHPNRKYITMLAKDNEIYWGYDNTVTVVSGTRIFKNQLLILPIGAGTSVWLVANIAGRNVSIGELA